MGNNPILPKAEKEKKAPDGQKLQAGVDAVKSDIQQDVDKKLEEKETKNETTKKLSWLKDAVDQNPIDKFKEEAKVLNDKYVTDIEKDLSSPNEEVKYKALGKLYGLIATFVIMPLNKSGVFTTEELKTKFQKDILEKLAGVQSLDSDKRKLVLLAQKTLVTDSSFGLDVETQKLIWDKFIEKTLMAGPYIDGAGKALNGENPTTEADKKQESLYKKHPGITLLLIAAGACTLYKAAEWIFGKNKKSDSGSSSEGGMSWWKKTGLCLLGFFGLGQVLGMDAVKKVLKGTWFDVDNNKLLKGLSLAAHGEFKEVAKLFGKSVYDSIAKVFGWGTYEEVVGKAKEKAGEIIESSKEILNEIEEKFKLSEAKKKLKDFVTKNFPRASKQAEETIDLLTPENVLKWAKDNGVNKDGLWDWFKGKGIESGSVVAAYILLINVLPKGIGGKVGVPAFLYLFCLNSGQGGLLDKFGENVAEFMENLKNDVVGLVTPFDSKIGSPLSSILKDLNFVDLQEHLFSYMNENPATATAIGSGVWLTKGYIWSIVKYITAFSLKAVLETGKFAKNHPIAAGTGLVLTWGHRRELVDKFTGLAFRTESKEKEEFKQKLLKAIGADGHQPASEKIATNAADTIVLDPLKEAYNRIPKIAEDLKSGKYLLAFGHGGALTLIEATTFTPVIAFGRFTAKEAQDIYTKLTDIYHGKDGDYLGIAAHVGGVAVGSKLAWESYKAAKEVTGFVTWGSKAGNAFKTMLPFSKQNIYVIKTAIEQGVKDIPVLNRIPYLKNIQGVFKWWQVDRNVNRITKEIDKLIAAGDYEKAAGLSGEFDNFLSGQIDIFNRTSPSVWKRFSLRYSKDWEIVKARLTQIKPSSTDLSKKLHELANETDSIKQVSLKKEVDKLRNVIKTSSKSASKAAETVAEGIDEGIKAGEIAAENADDVGKVAGAADDVVETGSKAAGKVTKHADEAAEALQIGATVAESTGGIKEIAIPANKLWELFHCKDAAKVTKTLENTIGRNHFVVDGVNKFDDAVEKIVSGQINAQTGLAGHVDDVAIKVGGTTTLFKGLVALQVVGAAVEAYELYKKVKEILDTDNSEMQKRMLAKLPMNIISLTVSAGSAYVGVASIVTTSAAAGAVLGSTAGAESIAAAGAGAGSLVIIPITVLIMTARDTIDSAVDSSLEDVMKPTDWMKKAGNNPSVLYQFWAETDESLRRGEATRTFFTAATEESILENKDKIRSVIVEAIVNLTFSEQQGWTPEEREAALLILKKSIGGYGWKISNINDAKNEIDNVGDMLTVIRGIKENNPEYINNKAFKGIVDLINLKPVEIIEKLSSHDISMVIKSLRRDVMGDTLESREDKEKELISKAKNIEEYVLLKYAQFFGYGDGMDIEKMKKNFFTEQASGQRGVYFKNGTWIVTHAGWEWDNKMMGKKDGNAVPLEGKPLLEAIANKLEANADDIFETRQDKLLDFATSSSTMKKQAQRLAQLIRNSVTRYGKYRPSEASPETGKKAA